MSAQPKYAMTPEDYLVFERASDEKHEYVDGEIYAMTGGSPEHNAIGAALIGLLFTQLRKRPCNVYTSDQRVKVSARQYYYPDVTVVCGTPDFESQRGGVSLTNPTVIIEVLSPSTEHYDRWTKAAYYAALPSLQDYLFVAQDQMSVELYSRNPEGAWIFKLATEKEMTLQIPSIDCTLTLADIYEKVIFLPAENRLSDE